MLAPIQVTARTACVCTGAGDDAADNCGAECADGSCPSSAGGPRDTRAAERYCAEGGCMGGRANALPRSETNFVICINIALLYQHNIK
jgi:hypothetical protein